VAGGSHNELPEEKISPAKKALTSTQLRAIFLAGCYLHSTNSMAKRLEDQLSKRERQIMDIIYRLGRGTAADVQAQLPNDPSYSTVRAQLRVLEEKGHVKHEEKDLRYVYLPTVPRDKAKRSALQHLLDTFFEGSAEQAVAALLDNSSSKMRPEELDRLSKLIEQAKREEV
jgi:BlaI family penicillinase repressor